jgi:hypothetical protein
LRSVHVGVEGRRDYINEPLLDFNNERDTPGEKPMKARNLLVTSAALIATAAAFAAGAWAQTQKAIWPVSDPLDAVVAAPRNHRVLYEDDHVRVLEVTVQPGETENRWP